MVIPSTEIPRTTTKADEIRKLMRQGVRPCDIVRLGYRRHVVYKLSQLENHKRVSMIERLDRIEAKQDEILRLLRLALDIDVSVISRRLREAKGKSDAEA